MRTSASSSRRSSMRPGFRAPVSRSDIEEADVLRVFLDEDPARLDLVPHQHREELAGADLVLDLDTDEQPPLRIHRRLPELVLVHLAETLEAGELDALLRQVERLVAQRLVRLGGPGLLVVRDREGRQAD